MYVVWTQWYNVSTFKKIFGKTLLVTMLEPLFFFTLCIAIARISMAVLPHTNGMPVALPLLLLGCFLVFF